MQRCVLRKLYVFARGPKMLRHAALMMLHDLCTIAVAFLMDYRALKRHACLRMRTCARTPVTLHRFTPPQAVGVRAWTWVRTGTCLSSGLCNKDSESRTSTAYPRHSVQWLAFHICVCGHNLLEMSLSHNAISCLRSYNPGCVSVCVSAFALA